MLKFIYCECGTHLLRRFCTMVEFNIWTHNQVFGLVEYNAPKTFHKTEQLLKKRVSNEKIHNYVKRKRN